MSDEYGAVARGVANRTTRARSLSETSIWTLMEVRTRPLSELVLPVPLVAGVPYEIPLSPTRSLSVDAEQLQELHDFKLQAQLRRSGPGIYRKPRAIASLLFLCDPDSGSWRWIHTSDTANGIQILNNHWVEVKKYRNGSVSASIGARYLETRESIAIFQHRAHRISEAKELYRGQVLVNEESIERMRKTNVAQNQWMNEFLYAGHSLKVARKLLFQRALNRFKATLLRLALEGLIATGALTPVRLGRGGSLTGKAGAPAWTKRKPRTARQPSKPRPKSAEKVAEAPPSRPRSLALLVKQGKIKKADIADVLAANFGGDRAFWERSLHFHTSQEHFRAAWEAASGVLERGKPFRSLAFYEHAPKHMIHVGPRATDLSVVFHEVIHAKAILHGPTMRLKLGRFLWEGITQKITQNMCKGPAAYTQGVDIAKLLEKKIGVQELQRLFLNGDVKGLSLAIRKALGNSPLRTRRFFELAKSLDPYPKGALQEQNYLELQRLLRNPTLFPRRPPPKSQ